MLEYEYLGFRWSKLVMLEKGKVRVDSRLDSNVEHKCGRCFCFFLSSFFFLGAFIASVRTVQAVLDYRDQDPLVKGLQCI